MILIELMKIDEWRKIWREGIEVESLHFPPNTNMAS